MKKTDTSKGTRISKSAAKRNQRRQAAATQKRKKQIYKGIGFALVACLCIVAIYFIVNEIQYRMNRTTASDDYSALLTADGKLDGIVSDPKV